MRIKAIDRFVLVYFQMHQMVTFLDFKLPLNYFINILTNKQASSYHTIILLQNQFKVDHPSRLVVKLPSSYEFHTLVIDSPFDLMV